jgi:N-methylhydantoinase A
VRALALAQDRDPLARIPIARKALGIDVGGTFTDAVLVAGDRVTTAKVPTSASQEESVLAAAAAVGAGDVERFTHGTTIATNTLLERRGARTALVATAGFEHVLHLRRQTRAHLYRPCAAHPEPLVPLERCVGVGGRMGKDGELAPLDVDTLPDLDAEAIAVCLLFAFRDDSHERAVAAELRRRYPAAHVVASHEVAPEFREYERASTTALDAYLGPVVSEYLSGLAEACRREGLRQPLVMRSSGGLATLDEAARHAAFVLLSGPAAGVVGAARIAGLAGFPNALAFDMGGTSTDVCAIVEGEARRDAEHEVGGFPVRLPTLAVHTVGAGGGSVVWRDTGGALRVGPESAGADPGPACYGHGGERPTVTDANLLLGRLPPVLPGGIELDEEAARRALADLDPGAVIEVVNAEMTRALRVVSVEQGLDPRDFALVAFGGAGPLHGCALADDLGVETVLVPAAAGVLSALGLVAADERLDAVRSYVVPLPDAGELPDEGEADLRYEGQSFELTVPLGARLVERFHAAHEERYGYADRARPLELVAIRTAEVRAAPPIEIGGPNLAASGPQVLELEGATAWVPEGWQGETDAHGTLVLSRT